MNEALPTRDQCLDLLTKSGCDELVLRHCQAVEELALRIARLTKGNEELVSVGALLHDIGRGRTHGIDHAVEGAKMARELGLCESVVLIIERHIGAGLSKDEAQKNGLPERDYVPRTLEEKIVSHADNLIEDNKKRKLREIMKQFEDLGYESVAVRIQKLHRELSEVCGIDLDLV